MQKQQKACIECQKCGQSVPQRNIQIHKVRCDLKSQKQSFAFPKTSRLSSSVRVRKQKIFDEPKKQISKETQQKIPCPFCGYMQTFSELDSHPGKCPGKQSICEFCGDGYPAKLMQEHEAVCEANENRQEEESEQNIYNPIQRLMRLIDLLNTFGALMRNVQSQEGGLPEQQLKKLKKIQIKQVKQDQICTICYCRFQKGQECLELKCKHIYHTECISKWLEKSSKCPVCKHDQKHDKKAQSRNK